MTALPLHEWQERRKALLDTLVDAHYRSLPHHPVGIKAEIYFQPYSNVPVIPFLWGEDGNLYNYNGRLQQYISPSSLPSRMLVTIDDHLPTETELNLILNHSKIHFFQEDQVVESKGYRFFQRKTNSDQEVKIIYLSEWQERHRPPPITQQQAAETSTLLRAACRLAPL